MDKAVDDKSHIHIFSDDDDDDEGGSDDDDSDDDDDDDEDDDDDTDDDDEVCMCGCSDKVSGFDVLPTFVLPHDINSSISAACVSPQSRGFSVRSMNSTPG